jgi:16S rRNA (uracil1498-N3)-methyltransferase
MMHRFFVRPESIWNGRVSFAEEQARQIRQVLRLRPGAEIVVLDNSGQEYVVTLTDVTSRHVSGRVESQRPSAGEPRVRLRLCQSLLPREKFEWVLQKGTEVGVSAFVPVLTQRSLARDVASVTPAKVARWGRIITEAAEQSGRGRLPELHWPVSFGEALGQAAASHYILLPWEKATQDSVGRALSRLTPDNQPAIALFIGPEGGYSDEEIEQATVARANLVTLGSRILRTETAAVVAAALVLYELGDMGLQTFVSDAG